MSRGVRGGCRVANENMKVILVHSARSCFEVWPQRCEVTVFAVRLLRPKYYLVLIRFSSFAAIF